MDTSSYEKRTIQAFEGLYDRGMADDCPSDHSPNCVNVIFDKRGLMRSRPGSIVSLTLTHTVVRQFLATFNNSTLKLITLDSNGNIYADSNATPIFTLAGMTDFVGLNMYNHFFFLPVGGSGGKLQVWDGTNAVRPALGYAPTVGSFTANDGAAGNVDVGIHKIAVCYITSTGFTTKPSSSISYTAPGSKKINLTNIPLGPAGTVGRLIIATKSNLELFYQVPYGTINDNTSTSLTIDFRDTDLAVSADYLFDQLEYVNGAGSKGGLEKFHGRMIVFGGEHDLIRVSKSGSPESFDSVTGYIQLPSEFDGNVVSSCVQLRDVLYFTKSVGIYSITDNGSEPSAWGNPIQIDGSTGSISIASITASQNSLEANDIVLLADFGGIYLFNGSVSQPPITYKIENAWKTYVYPGVVGRVTMFIDPFQKLIYVNIVGCASLLVGDYTNGLDYKNIKWVYWTFPYPLANIAVSTYSDVTGWGYYLRFGMTGINGLYRISPTAYNDFSNAIATTYQTFLASFSLGAVNIFRGIRLRAKSIVSSLTMSLFLTDEGANTSSVPGIVLGNSPKLDYFREINYTAEKMSVTVYYSGSSDGIVIQRIDIFGKEQWGVRPA